MQSAVIPPVAYIASMLAFVLTPEVAAADIARIVVHGKTLTAGGSQVVLRGISTSDPARMSRNGLWTPECFKQIRDWGSSVVRFPVHPESWREVGESSYLELLDRGIAMARHEGLYVVIDWHSIGNLHQEKFFTGGAHHPTSAYNTSIEETFDFWRVVAKRYGHDPTVAFYELFNEPVQGQELGEVLWSEWRELMERLISSIRSAGGEGVPLVAGFDFAYDLTRVVQDPVEAAGVGYVSHPYPGKVADPERWTEQWTKDWGHVADTFPVVLTEVGFQYEGEPGGYDPIVGNERYVEELHRYATERGVSYIVWCFDEDWVPSLIVDRDFSPSPSGLKFRDAMRAAAGRSAAHQLPPNTARP